MHWGLQVPFRNAPSARVQPDRREERKTLPNMELPPSTDPATTARVSVIRDTRVSKLTPAGYA